MEQTKNSKSWGGARQGSGRKAMDASVKKGSCTISLTQEEKAKLQETARAAGLSTSEFVSKWIQTL